MFVFSGLIIAFTLLHGKVSGISFDGSCPEIPEVATEPKLSCKDFVGQSESVSYIAYGLLPVYGIVSPFLNNWDVKCIGFEIKCSATKDTYFSLAQGCYGESDIPTGTFGPPKTTSFDHYGTYGCFVGMPTVSCMPIVYDTEIVPDTDQIRNFGLIFENTCPGQMGNFTIHTIVRDQFVVLYGCMDKPATNSHEEGIWIMVKDSEVAALSDAFYETFVGTVLEMLPGISATSSNFITVDFRELYLCNCTTCTVTSSCPPPVTEEKEDDYSSDYVYFSSDDYKEYSAYDDANKATK